MKSKSIILLFIIAAQPLFSQTPWQRIEAPPAYTMYDVTHFAGIFWICSPHRVLSLNKGHWENELYLPQWGNLGDRIFSDHHRLFEFSRQNAFGFYMTPDTSQTWTNIPLGTDGAELVAVSDTILYAAMRQPFINNPVLMRSRNWGMGWELLYDDPDADRFFDLHTEGPDSVLFAIPSGLYRSVNQGDSFALVSTALNHPELKDLRIFINQGIYWAYCFYADFMANSSRKLFRSANKGLHWEDVTSPIFQDWQVNDLVSWGGGVHLYTPSGLYSTYDDGQNWEHELLPVDYMKIAVENDTVYAATTYGFMYKGGDQTDWNVVFDSLPTEKAFRDRPTALQKINGALWVVAGSLFKYHPQNSPAWSIGGLGYTSSDTENFFVKGNTVIAQGSYGASRSVDKGATWQDLPHPNQPYWENPFFAFSSDSTLHGIDQATYGYKTSDMGDNWESTFAIGMDKIRGMGVYKDTVFWCGTPPTGSDQVWGWDNNAFSYTLNGGTILFLASIGDEVYAATAGRFFRYVGANQWRETANAPVMDVSGFLNTEFTGDQNILLLAHNLNGAAGTTYSTDKGETWSQLMPMPASLAGVEELYFERPYLYISGKNVNNVYELWSTHIDSLIAPISSVINHDQVPATDKWTLFPNPTQDDLRIVFAEPLQESVQCRILDANGRCRFEQRLDAGTSSVLLDCFGVRGIQAGVYMVFMKGKRGVSVRKLIVVGRF